MTSAREALHSSESNEWYTPAEYVRRAREAMGGIDLDPASCLQAQETVQAVQWYGTGSPWAENALAVQWRADRLWLNPPYGWGQDHHDKRRSNLGIWTRRAIGAWALGYVDQATLLVPAVTDRRWFQALWPFPVVLLYERISFDSPESVNKANNPTHGHAVVYLPPDRDSEEDFYESWEGLGRKVRPERPTDWRKAKRTAAEFLVS